MTPLTTMKSENDRLGDSQTGGPPLPPLQSAHSYMYMTPKQQERFRQKEGLKPDRSWRHSRSNLAPNIETTNSALRRRTSTFGLLGLFSRNKLTESEPIQERLEQLEEKDTESERPRSGETEQTGRAESVASAKSLGLRPLVETETTPIRQRPSNTALQPRPSFKEVTLRTPNTWDPPPLFQAYPQAVKYATLVAPALTAEAILRLNHERKNMGRRRKPRLSSEHTDSRRPVSAESLEKRLRKASASEILSKGEWTEKIFVLVTSGYFLQYAGQGPYDRLPEKILTLSKDSAAFASDAIPGKHFVLQVSRVAEDDGAANSEVSKSMFKRLGTKSDVKRSTSALLLVLETPEQMSEWLVVVRKEIEAMGGKEYRPDVLQKGSEPEMGAPLRHTPSQRYNVKRDPHRFSGIPRETAPEVGNGDAPTEEIPVEAVKTAASVNVKRPSLVTQKSPESPYISDTTGSIDQDHLDRLRESPTRSQASTGVGTTATSRESSVDHSPVDRKTEPFHDVKARASTAYPYTGGTRPTLDQHADQTPEPDSDRLTPTPTPTTRPVSVAFSQSRSASPTAPNFSVPTFSKRFSQYSNISSSPPPSVRTQVPSIITPQENNEPPKSGTPEVSTNRESVLGELFPRPVIGSKASRRHSGPAEQPTRLGTTPSASSCDRPLTSANDRPFSRRMSSLEYAKGISPIALTINSPSPHPPPTAPLPPVPNSDSVRRISPTPPPKGPLPPLPMGEPSPPSSSSREAIPLPPVPSVASPIVLPFQSPPLLDSSFAESAPARNLRRPISMQIPRSPDMIPDSPPPPPPPPADCKPTFYNDSVSPPSSIPPPPKPTRTPPPPPLPPKPLSHKSMPRLERDSPPVYPTPTAPKYPITIVPTAGNTQQEAAPHPFIPPLRVSERMSRGSLSLDGPWNANYDPPKRTYLDLNFD